MALIPQGLVLRAAATVVSHVSSGMLRRFFAAPMDHYIDDGIIIEPDLSAGPRSLLASPCPGRIYPRSAQARLWDFSEDLGAANWSPQKSSKWQQIIDPIGMVIDFSS